MSTAGLGRPWRAFDSGINEGDIASFCAALPRTFLAEREARLLESFYSAFDLAAAAALHFELSPEVSIVN